MDADANEDGQIQDVPLLFQQCTARTEQSPGAYHGAEIAYVFGNLQVAPFALSGYIG